MNHLKLEYFEDDLGQIKWDQLPADVRSPWQAYYDELKLDYDKFKNLQSKVLLQQIEDDPHYLKALYKALPEVRRTGTIYLFLLVVGGLFAKTLASRHYQQEFTPPFQSLSFSIISLQKKTQKNFVVPTLRFSSSGNSL